jgi:hypothetical protein
VLLKIVYLLTCRVLGLAILAFRGDRAKDVEARTGRSLSSWGCRQDQEPWRSVRKPQRRRAVRCTGEVVPGKQQGVAGGVMTVKLQVRLLVRTLSLPVRGVSRSASLSARTYSGQGKLFT